MIVDNGIHAGMSSDGMQIAPMNPWIHAYYATTGLNARGVLINGGQQITRQRGARASTPATTVVPRRARRTSSARSRWAGSPTSSSSTGTTSRVPEEELKQIRSVLTIVGGGSSTTSGDSEGTT